MSVLILSYLYKPAVMLVLSWNLMEHYGLEGLHNTGQKQVILSSVFCFVWYFCGLCVVFLFVWLLFFFFLDTLSATVGSPGHCEALRDCEKRHQSVLNQLHFMMFLFSRYSS